MDTAVLESTVKTRVVILGGGFGGLHAALHLDKSIAAEPNVEVTSLPQSAGTRVYALQPLNGLLPSCSRFKVNANRSLP